MNIQQDPSSKQEGRINAVDGNSASATAPIPSASSHPTDDFARQSFNLNRVAVSYPGGPEVPLEVIAKAYFKNGNTAEASAALSKAFPEVLEEALAGNGLAAREVAANLSSDVMRIKFTGWPKFIQNFVIKHAREEAYACTAEGLRDGFNDLVEFNEERKAGYAAELLLAMEEIRKKSAS